jgi:peroxiredoxin
MFTDNKLLLNSDPPLRDSLFAYAHLLSFAAHLVLVGRAKEGIVKQAEIAGGTLTAPNELPSVGRRLNDIELASVLGPNIALSDYRGRANLVLIAADDGGPTAALAERIARQYAQIKNEDAVVLLILQDSSEAALRKTHDLKIPYPVLIDEDGRIHRELGAIDATGKTGTAVYITDRFGEVFGVYRTGDGTTLPSYEEIVHMLEFVNSQCPECDAPEWPA